MNWYIVLPLLQALVCLALAYFVIRNNTASTIHRLFAVFLFSLTVWAIIIFGMRSAPDLQTAYAWERFLPPVGLLTAVSLFHFSILYTGRNIRQWFVVALYALCVIFIPLSFTDLIYRSMRMMSYGYAPVFGPVAPIFMLFTFGLPVVTLAVFISKLPSFTSYKERNRLLYIIIGIFIGMGGGIFDVLPTFGLPLYPGLIIGNIILCLLITIAIVRENLLDIRIVLRKGTAYFLTSGIIALPFILIGIVVSYVLGQFSMPAWVYVVMVVLAAMALPPLWRLTQGMVDRWFSRDRYETLKALESLIKDTQSLDDSQKLGSAFVELITRYVRASGGYLMQPAGPADDYIVTCSTAGGYAQNVIIKKDSALIPWLERSGEMVDIGGLDLVPQLQRVIYREKYEFARMGAELLVPLMTPAMKLAALLVLGKKASEQSYSNDDRELIYSASTQMVNKLENMRLYEHVLKSRENLENLVNSISDHILILNSDRQVQFMSKSAVQTFGDKLGRECWDVLGKGEVCPECYLGPAVSFQRLTKSVGGRYYDAIITPLANPDGSTSLIEVLRDVTQQQQHEEDMAKSYQSIKKMLNDTITAIARIVELRDPYTSGHQRRVTELAIAIAHEMQLDEKRIEDLRMAASIHDIGKIYVASDILSKPGKLSDMEMALIRTHAASGYDVVKDIDFPQPVAVAVLQHHERLDGSGYPSGLKGDEILLEARIIAVADTVEAMSSHRPYRPSLGVLKALEEVSQKSGQLYDPDVVNACLKLFKEKSFSFSEISTG